jgi:hypothetical protein
MAKANPTSPFTDGLKKKHIAVDHLVGFERPDDTSKLDDRGVICLTMYGDFARMLPFKRIN